MFGPTKTLLRNELHRTMRALGAEDRPEGAGQVVDIASGRVEIDVRETSTTSTPSGPMSNPWGIDADPGVDIPTLVLTRSKGRERLRELARYTAHTGGAMFKNRWVWAGRR